MRSGPVAIIVMVIMLSLAFSSVVAETSDGKALTARISDSMQYMSFDLTGTSDSTDEELTVYYFWAIGCPHCAATSPYIDGLAAEYPQVPFLKLEVSHNSTNWALYQDFNSRYHVENQQVPSVFAGGEALIGEDAVKANLEPIVVGINNILTGPPTAPQSLRATPGDAFINLTWETPVRDGGSNITNYEVWRGTSNGTEVFLADAGTRLWFNDTGLSNGQTYYYVVKAENVKGPSPNSNEVFAQPSQTLLVPTAPQVLNATEGDGFIVLTWSHPVNDGGAAITDYRIYRVTTPDVEPVLISHTSESTYNDTGLNNGQTYIYMVSAVNSVGEGPNSSSVQATPAEPPVPKSSTELTVITVIAAAAVDSINPCAISVMIFLLLFLTSLGNKRRVLLVGLTYIITVYIVYFVAGLGLLTFLQSVSITRYVYYAAAVLSIAIGLLNIKDFFFPGDKPTVAIPESRKPMIKKYIEKASIPAAVMLGGMVALFELPCTGAIYFAILNLLNNSMTMAEGIPYLALYNAIFVLPLIVILVVILMGVSAEKANSWRLENRSILRLVVGVVMVALGALMLSGVF